MTAGNEFQDGSYFTKNFEDAILQFFGLYCYLQELCSQSNCNSFVGESFFLSHCFQGSEAFLWCVKIWDGFYFFSGLSVYFKLSLFILGKFSTIISSYIVSLSFLFFPSEIFKVTLSEMSITCTLKPSSYVLI